VNAGWPFSLKYYLVLCPKYRKQILVEGLAKKHRELLYQKAKESKAKRKYTLSKSWPTT
jgi:REP element-mobilizing transposase RayT